MWEALAIGGAALSSFIGGMFTNASNAQSAQNQIMAQQQAQGASQEFSFAENERNRNLQVASQANAQTYQDAQANYARDWQVQQRLGIQDWQHGQREAAQDWTQGQREQTQAWEAGMSNTAYQRSVSDMRAAGLNPILGVHSGGASTPSMSPGSSHAGSSSSAGSPSPTSSGVSGSAGSVAGISGSQFRAVNYLGESVNTGLSAARTLADLRNIQQGIERSQAEIDLTRAHEQNVDSQTALNRMRPDVIRAELKNLGLTSAQIEAMTTAQQAAAVASHGSATASLAQAGLSGAQTTQQRRVTEAFERTGALPTTSHIATEATVAERVLQGVARDIGKLYDWATSRQPKGTSAQGNR